MSKPTYEIAKENNHQAVANYLQQKMKNVNGDEKLLVISDTNLLILQAMQQMEERARQAKERIHLQMAASEERMAASEQLMAEVAEKLCGNSAPRSGGDSNKSCQRSPS